jgi:4-hydroxybenzoate polyprenyltransferase
MKNDSKTIMKNLPKLTLVLAVVNLIVGLFVTISHRELPVILDLAMPLAFIFAGLAVITRALQNEVVKFDEDQRRQRSSARPLAVGTTEVAAAAAGNPLSAGSKLGSAHSMSAEGLWLRGVMKKFHH